MRLEFLRLVSLACFCVVAIPLLSFGQLNAIPASPLVKSATTSPDGADAFLRDVFDASGLGLFPWVSTQDEPAPNDVAEAFFSDQNQTTPGNQPQSPPQDRPKGANGQTGTPSLPDLFPPSETQANPQLQARLNKRTHMLKAHQTLGLITAIPMAAALITGPQAAIKGRDGQTIHQPTPANLDFHIALGAATTDLYWTTAYYEVFAPKISNVKPKGAIRLHRDLEWIHGPGMIATGILGILAYRQENAGEKVHGIASAHGAVAYVAAAAYGASIISVSWPIHLKFWEHDHQ